MLKLEQNVGKNKTIKFKYKIKEFGMPVKQQIGIVISNKMQKTIVVKIENRYPHPIYSKTLVKTKKYLAHDEYETCMIGDQVLLEECRPLSKKKRWKLVEILSKSSVIN